jgi:hypothetical protein
MSEWLELHFLTKSTQRTRAKTVELLKIWSVKYDEKNFRETLQCKMLTQCPKVDFVAPECPGVAFVDFIKTMNSLLAVPFWSDKCDFDSEGKETPLIRISADGTQAGEMFTWNLEVVGATILNTHVRLFYSKYGSLDAVLQVSSVSAILCALGTCANARIQGGNGAVLVEPICFD